jgi:pimeloyl-ACP methyl ester carboxylesterase
MSVISFIKFYCGVILVTLGILLFLIICIPIGIIFILIDEIQRLFSNKKRIFSISTSAENLTQVEKNYADKIAINSSLKGNSLYYESLDQKFDIEVNKISKIKVQSHSNIFRKHEDDVSLPIIIFIHGANAGPMTFFKIAAELSNHDFEIHCIALPGFGETVVSNELLQLNSKQLKDFYAKYLATYITLNCNSKPHLVGHSFGGFLVSSLVVEFPNLCESFVLCNPAGILPIFGKDTMMWGLLFKFGFPKIYYITRRIGLFINLSYFAYNSIKNNYDPYDYWSILQMTMNCSENFGETVVSKFVYFNGIETYWRDCTLADLLSTKIPPLSLIWGHDDTIVPLAYAKIIGSCVEKGSSPVTIYSILDTWHTPTSNETEFTLVLLKALKSKRSLVSINDIKHNQLENFIVGPKVYKATCNYSFTDTVIKSMYSNVRDVLEATIEPVIELAGTKEQEVNPLIGADEKLK